MNAATFDESFVIRGNARNSRVIFELVNQFTQLQALLSRCSIYKGVKHAGGQFVQRKVEVLCVALDQSPAQILDP